MDDFLIFKKLLNKHPYFKAAFNLTDDTPLTDEVMANCIALYNGVFRTYEGIDSTKAREIQAFVMRIDKHMTGKQIGEALGVGASRGNQLAKLGGYRMARAIKWHFTMQRRATNAKQYIEAHDSLEQLELSNYYKRALAWGAYTKISELLAQPLDEIETDFGPHYRRLPELLSYLYARGYRHPEFDLDKLSADQMRKLINFKIEYLEQELRPYFEMLFRLYTELADKIKIDNAIYDTYTGMNRTAFIDEKMNQLWKLFHK